MLFENYTIIDKLKKSFLMNGFDNDDISELEIEKYFDNIEYFDENTLIVYRAIEVLDDNIDYSDIGKYWSFSKNTYPIWRNDDDNDYYDVRCKGLLKFDDIDWRDMMVAYKNDFHNFCDEKEIRGYIKVISCEKINDI